MSTRIIKSELPEDVLICARKRIKNVFQTAPKVYISFSGGKDSIVLSDIIFKMCIAGEIDRRKVEIEFIDEEAIYPCVDKIVREWRDLWMSIGVQFNWWCIQVKHFSCLNSLTQEETFICWDEEKKDVWIREKPSFARSAHPLLKERNETYQSFLQKYEGDGVSIIGVRMAESMQRVQNIAAVMTSGSNKNIFPIYDMKDQDVWFYIKQNNLNIPDAYLYMWQIGRPKNNLRISQFFSVDTIGSLSEMAQYYPDLYNKIIQREPNAYMTMLYYDTELFRRSKRTKKTEEVDYKKKFFDFLKSPSGENAISSRPKEIQQLLKYTQFSVYITQNIWKVIYECAVAGNPKNRTIRAIFTSIQIERKKRNNQTDYFN